MGLSVFLQAAGKQQKGRVTFDDFDGLVSSVDFDKAYLDQDVPLLR